MAGLTLPALEQLRVLLEARGLSVEGLGETPAPPPDPRPVLGPLLAELEQAHDTLLLQWRELGWQAQLLQAALDAGVAQANAAQFQEIQQAQDALQAQLKALRAQGHRVRARLDRDLAQRQAALHALEKRQAAPRLGVQGPTAPLGRSVFEAVDAAIAQQHDRILLQEQQHPEHPPAFYWDLKDRLDAQGDRSQALGPLAPEAALSVLESILRELHAVQQALSSGPAPTS